MSDPTLLMVALDPNSIELPPASGRSVESIARAGAEATSTLEARGYEVHHCQLLPDDGLEELEALLGHKQFDTVLIGAGLRALPAHTVLFERVMNVIHSLAPSAALRFNSSPTDVVNAVERTDCRPPPNRDPLART